MYQKYNPKKELIKNIVIITFILLIAVISTYKIYYHFNRETDIDYSSTSLDITFHEKNGEKLDITKVTPLNDAVGLSSKGHTLTIHNNLTEPVKYNIKIVDNIENISSHACEDISIPKEEIKISIKDSNAQTEFYNLSDFEDGIVISKTIDALAEEKYTIRLWVSSETSLQTGSSHHYHGLIQVFENDQVLAVK